MKQIVSFIVLITLVSCNSSSNQNNDDIGMVQDEIKKLEYDALVAEFKLDTAAIAVIMDDDFVSIDEHSIGNKKTELAGIYNNISERLKKGHTVDSFFLDQFRVDLFDNTAIATFFTVTNGHIGDSIYKNRRTRFYDVWIKRNGQWKLVSMQATFL